MTSDIFRPFAEGESAALWLGIELRLNGLSRKALYALTITEQIFSKNIHNGKAAKLFRRMPEDAVLWGNQQRDRKAVQATLLLRGNAGAGAAHSDDGHPGKEAAIEPALLLERWARSNGWWNDDVDSSLAAQFKYLSEGGEAKVFRYDGKTVIKRITAPGAGGVQMLIDRLTLHNSLFPDTALTVVGFGRGAQGNFSAVVLQPYVRGERTNVADTALMVTDAGFHVIDGVRVPYTFFTDEYCLGDLHERNVLTDEDGELRVIDCDVRLNEPCLGYGGTWEIPAIQGESAAVRQISDEIARLTPRSVPLRSLAGQTGETALKEIQRQLADTGRYEGMVYLEDGDGAMRECLLQDDENDGCVLVSDCGSVRTLLSLEDAFDEVQRDRMARGEPVVKDGFRYAFDAQTGSVKPAV